MSREYDYPPDEPTREEMEQADADRDPPECICVFVICKTSSAALHNPDCYWHGTESTPNDEAEVPAQGAERKACCDLDAPIVKCIICKRDTFTCELKESINGSYACPAHPDGVELSARGQWVCSEPCWDAACEIASLRDQLAESQSTAKYNFEEFVTANRMMSATINDLKSKLEQARADGQLNSRRVDWFLDQLSPSMFPDHGLFALREVSAAMRYSAKIGMHRQQGLDAIDRACERWEASKAHTSQAIDSARAQSEPK